VGNGTGEQTARGEGQEIGPSHDNGDFAAEERVSFSFDRHYHITRKAAPHQERGP